MKLLTILPKGKKKMVNKYGNCVCGGNYILCCDDCGEPKNREDDNIDD